MDKSKEFKRNSWAIIKHHSKIKVFQTADTSDFILEYVKMFGRNFVIRTQISRENFNHLWGLR